MCSISTPHPLSPIPTKPIYYTKKIQSPLLSSSIYQTITSQAHTRRTQEISRVQVSKQASKHHANQRPTPLVSLLSSPLPPKPCSPPPDGESETNRGTTAKQNATFEKKKKRIGKFSVSCMDARTMWPRGFCALLGIVGRSYEGVKHVKQREAKHGRQTRRRDKTMDAVSERASERASE